MAKEKEEGTVKRNSLVESNMTKKKNKGVSNERIEELISKVRKGDNLSFKEMLEIQSIGMDPDKFIADHKDVNKTKEGEVSMASQDASVKDAYHPDVVETQSTLSYVPSGVFSVMNNFAGRVINNFEDPQTVFNEFIDEVGVDALYGIAKDIAEDKGIKPKQALDTLIKNLFSQFKKGGTSIGLHEKLDKRKEWGDKETQGHKLESKAKSIIKGALDNASDEEIFAAARNPKDPNHIVARYKLAVDRTLRGKYLSNLDPALVQEEKRSLTREAPNLMRMFAEQGAEYAATGPRANIIAQAAAQVAEGQKLSVDDWKKIAEDHPNQPFYLTWHKDPIHKNKDGIYTQTAQVRSKDGSYVATIIGHDALKKFREGILAAGNEIKHIPEETGEKEGMSQTDADFDTAVNRFINTGDTSEVYPVLTANREKEKVKKERSSTYNKHADDEDTLVANGETSKYITRKGDPTKFAEATTKLNEINSDLATMEEALADKLDFLKQASEELAAYKANMNNGEHKNPRDLRELIRTRSLAANDLLILRGKRDSLLKAKNLAQEVIKKTDPNEPGYTKDLIGPWRIRNGLSDPAYDEILNEPGALQQIASALKQFGAWKKEHTDNNDRHIEFKSSMQNAINKAADELGMDNADIESKLTNVFKFADKRGGLNDAITYLSFLGKLDPAAKAVYDNLGDSWKDGSKTQITTSRKSAFTDNTFGGLISEDKAKELFGDTASQYREAGLSDKQMALMKRLAEIKTARNVNPDNIVSTSNGGVAVNLGSQKIASKLPGKGNRVQSVLHNKKDGSTPTKHLTQNFVDSAGRVKADNIENRVRDEMETKGLLDNMLTERMSTDEYKEKQKSASYRMEAVKKANEAEDKANAKEAAKHVREINEAQASGKNKGAYEAGVKNAEENKKKYEDDLQRNGAAYWNKDTSIDGVFKAEQSRNFEERNKTAEDRLKESTANVERAKQRGVSQETLDNLEKNQRIDAEAVKSVKEAKEAKEASDKAAKEQAEAKVAAEKAIKEQEDLKKSLANQFKNVLGTISGLRY